MAGLLAWAADVVGGSGQDNNNNEENNQFSSVVIFTPEQQRYAQELELKSNSLKRSIQDLRLRIPPPDISQRLPHLHAHSLASNADLALQLSAHSTTKQQEEEHKCKKEKANAPITVTLKALLTHLPLKHEMEENNCNKAQSRGIMLQEENAAYEKAISTCEWKIQEKLGETDLLQSKLKSYVEEETRSVGSGKLFADSLLEGEVQSTPYKDKEKIRVAEALNDPRARRAAVVAAVRCTLTVEAALLRSENLVIRNAELEHRLEEMQAIQKELVKEAVQHELAEHLANVTTGLEERLRITIEEKALVEGDLEATHRRLKTLTLEKDAGEQTLREQLAELGALHLRIRFLKEKMQTRSQARFNSRVATWVGFYTEFYFGKRGLARKPLVRSYIDPASERKTQEERWFWYIVLRDQVQNCVSREVVLRAMAIEDVKAANCEGPGYGLLGEEMEITENHLRREVEVIQTEINQSSKLDDCKTTIEDQKHTASNTVMLDKLEAKRKELNLMEEKVQELEKRWMLVQQNSLSQPSPAQREKILDKQLHSLIEQLASKQAQAESLVGEIHVKERELETLNGFRRRLDNGAMEVNTRSRLGQSSSWRRSSPDFIIETHLRQPYVGDRTPNQQRLMLFRSAFVLYILILHVLVFIKLSF
ncbi:hypothetical protein GIB67_038520 [Kingdonia uniflora]|uniref:Uncharacterized protein n=1 Tax=Kingdonia uniflora TaxID=39325 RepID=A0A7J7NPI2_9MAGN|nr:hypothetical protein GIB67_038520 [Kingdonia uniflora]